MKPRFQSVPPAERMPVIEAREACVADNNENKVVLVSGGKFNFVFLLCNKAWAHYILMPLLV
jgi:hypothetical protein